MASIGSSWQADRELRSLRYRGRRRCLPPARDAGSASGVAGRNAKPAGTAPVRAVRRPYELYGALPHSGSAPIGQKKRFPQWGEAFPGHFGGRSDSPGAFPDTLRAFPTRTAPFPDTLAAKVSDRELPRESGRWKCPPTLRSALPVRRRAGPVGRRVREKAGRRRNPPSLGAPASLPAHQIQKREIANKVRGNRHRERYSIESTEKHRTRHAAGGTGRRPMESRFSAALC